VLRRFEGVGWFVSESSVVEERSKGALVRGFLGELKPAWLGGSGGCVAAALLQPLFGLFHKGQAEQHLPEMWQFPQMGTSVPADLGMSLGWFVFRRRE
jgi:hypothetical protein